MKDTCKKVPFPNSSGTAHSNTADANLQKLWFYKQAVTSEKLKN